MLNSERRPANPAAIPAIDDFLIGAECVEAKFRMADQLACEDLLQHRRGHADHADTGRHVQAEDPPDQPELRCLVCILKMHIVLRDHRIRLRGRSPALRAPSGRRNAIAERADQHEEEVDCSHCQESLPNADVGRCLEIIHQQVGEGCTDHGAAAEAHDGHAGCHAAPIREPFHQRGHGRDVTKAEAQSANHAGAEPQQPQLMADDADRAEHEAAAPQDCGCDASLARTGALNPSTEHCRGDAEEHEEQRVHPAEAGDLPVARRGEELGDDRHIRAGLRCGQTDRARQRQPEHREAVGHADAEMNAERGRWHQPAIETGRGYDAFTVENARDAATACEGLVDCRHARPLGFLRVKQRLCAATVSARIR